MHAGFACFRAFPKDVADDTVNGANKLTMPHQEPSAIAMTAAPAGTASLAELRDHRQRAVELEYATLPPYLCALCSLARERNPEIVEAVHGVLTERIVRIVARDHGTRIARGSAGGDVLVWPIEEMT
jgi:hypothetical protein